MAVTTEADGHTKYMSYAGGTYFTERGGFVEFNHEDNEWEAWHDLIEGVTAHFEDFEEAVQWAWYGDGQISYDEDGKAVLKEA